jgi:hypothetical protein
MKRWLLMMALTVGACGSTAVGYPASATPAQQWRPESAPSDERTETTEPPQDQPEVVIVATAPSAVQFHPDARDVIVPLRHVRPPTITPRRARVHQGMWIGAGIGILAGALSGIESERNARSDPDASCPGCFILGAAVFGAIGLGLGAAAGAVIGAFDNP